MPIYHRIPEQLIGSTLRPLNLLREGAPDLHARYLQKYEGRESALRQRIPGLDCLWNDVIHFSPVHPFKIVEALVEAELPHQPSRWFEVEPEEHGFD